MLSDLRFALRTLLKAPGFAAVAILTLALGVGANTAIYSVIHAVLLRPFPYTDPERILFVGSTRLGQQGQTSVAYPDFLDWRARSRSFEALAFANGHSVTLTGLAEPALIRGASVSAAVWRLLGIAPVLGRTFTDAEDRPGAAPVCVLSHAMWQNRLGGDARVLGRTLTLDGKPYTVIGVMPPRFRFWAGDVWLPAGLEADTELMRSRVVRFDAWVVAKPKPDVSQRAAEAELNLIAAQLALEHPDSNKGLGVATRLLSDSVTGNFRRPLLVLLAAVGCVLLIACANVANLLLARAATRQREYAVRLALGASRSRLIRQTLLETLPLAVLGGLAGVLLGAWGLQAMLLILPPDSVPAEAQITVNGPVMIVSLVTVLVTMFGFALFPALQCSNPPLSQGLQEGGRGTESGRTARVRAALVVAEVGLSVTLLVGAGLLIRSVLRLASVDLGFDARNLLVMPVQLPQVRYPTAQQATAFFEQLVERAAHLPTVKAVAATNNAPFSGGTGMPLIVEGKTYADINDLDGVQFGIVIGDYFRAAGMRLVEGRAFTAADRAGSEPVIILNEAAVKRYLNAGSAVGKRVMLGLPDNLLKPGLLPAGFDSFQWATVVGVVRSARHFDLQSEPPPAAYIPVGQSWAVRDLRAAMSLVVRTEGDPLRAVRDLRSILASLDRDQPVGRVATMETIVGEALRPSRFNAILLSLFAAIAVVLAAVGIYGVVAWNVTQRTREFGIRQALGAEPRDVLGLVLRHGLKVVGAGVVLGLAAALAIARGLQSMLFEVSAFDPWTFMGVAVLLTAVATLAAVIPARRATRVDPAVALRAE